MVDKRKKKKSSVSYSGMSVGNNFEDDEDFRMEGQSDEDEEDELENLEEAIPVWDVVREISRDTESSASSVENEVVVEEEEVVDELTVPEWEFPEFQYGDDLPGCKLPSILGKEEMDEFVQKFGTGKVIESGNKLDYKKMDLEGSLTLDIHEVVGATYQIVLSHSGEMLCAVNGTGHVTIWDIEERKILLQLRDMNADRMKSSLWEFYAVVWSPDDSCVVVGGKAKDRYRWDEFDDDNSILHSPLLIFDLKQQVDDLTNGKIPEPISYSAHTEEIICLTSCTYKNQFYYVSGGYDGAIVQWRMKSDYKSLEEKRIIIDGISNVVLCLDFVPNCGNRYLLAGCDTSVKLFDFEYHICLKTFETDFTAYVDSFQWIKGSEDFPLVPNDYKLIVRGVEERKSGKRSISSNRLQIFSVKYDPKGDITLDFEQLVKPKVYKSNKYLVKFANDGHNVLCPCEDGKVLTLNMKTQNQSRVFREHKGRVVRCVLLEPKKKRMFTCSDGPEILIYKQGAKNVIEKPYRGGRKKKQDT